MKLMDFRLFDRLSKAAANSFAKGFCQVCRDDFKGIRSDTIISDAHLNVLINKVDSVIPLLADKDNLANSTKQDYEKSMRLFVRLIKRYESGIADPAVLSKARELCKKIAGSFGETPVLNPVVTIPDSIKANLESSKLWEAPTRSGDGAQKVGFVPVKVTEEGEVRETAAVRVELAKEYKMDLEQMDVVYAYEAGTFERMQNMQIDHIMPSARILERQLELIEAMNLDPEGFGNTVLHSAENDGYILKSNGKYIGTEKFFMTYHNALNNVWVLTPEANNRKRDQDPVRWLAKSRYFGADFMSTVPRINRGTIIYTVGDGGRTLGEVAKDWFREHHGPTLGLRLIAKWIEKKLARQSDKLISRIAAATAGNSTAGTVEENKTKLEKLNVMTTSLYVGISDLLRETGVDSSPSSTLGAGGTGARSLAADPSNITNLVKIEKRAYVFAKVKAIHKEKRNEHKRTRGLSKPAAEGGSIIANDAAVNSAVRAGFFGRSASFARSSVAGADRIVPRQLLREMDTESESDMDSVADDSQSRKKQVR